MLTMNTIIDMKINGGIERRILSEMYNPDIYGTEEDFFAFVNAWIQTGRAKVVEPSKSKEAEIADQIADELMQVQKAKEIQQDFKDRMSYNDNKLGVYKKVGFPAKSLIDAQEMHNLIIKHYNISTEQLGVEMQGTNIIVTITNCPAKVYTSLDRMFGVKRAGEAVTTAVHKTANTVLNTADITINSVAAPVAKTAVATTAKVAKSLFGFGAKLAGIAISEVTKATKQCVNEIKNDTAIQEAKGEVMEGVHSVKKFANSKHFTGGNGGQIIE